MTNVKLWLAIACVVISLTGSEEKALGELFGQFFRPRQPVQQPAGTSVSGGSGPLGAKGGGSNQELSQSTSGSGNGTNNATQTITSPVANNTDNNEDVVIDRPPSTTPLPRLVGR